MMSVNPDNVTFRRTVSSRVSDFFASAIHFSSMLKVLALPSRALPCLALPCLAQL
jgi:hypothetical protein